MNLPFEDRESVHVRAISVGERLDLRVLERTGTLALSPLMITAGNHGAAVLFRYGVVVLFDVEPVEEASFLNHLKPLVTDPYAKPETEEALIRIDPNAGERADNGVITLHAMEVERLQLVADILARTVALAESEAATQVVFEMIEPLAVELQKGTSKARHAKELLRHIGGTLLMQHRMVGRVEVEEKPDLLWDRPVLERLYHRLFDEYDLRERHRALERKLALVSRTAETLLGLLHHRVSLRVEWYIVILIVAEMLLMVGEMILRG